MTALEKLHKEYVEKNSCPPSCEVTDWAGDRITVILHRYIGDNSWQCLYENFDDIVVEEDKIDIKTLS